MSYTLITGASEGLGVEFARIAAREGRNLILAARNTDKMEALAAQLRTDEVDVIVIGADLNDLAEADRLWHAATDGRQIDVLVNNAGLGSNGDFAEGQNWQRELSSINVNMLALTRLMKLAIPHMDSLPKARILNIASVASFVPGPNMAVYHASKAYVLSLSEAVAEELRGSKITVSAICPGATATNFAADAQMETARAFQMAKPMTAKAVAEEGWLKARIGQRVIVTGALNKLTVLLPRIMPRSLIARLTGYVMGKA